MRPAIFSPVKRNQSYPISYDIDQLGAVPRKLAITFDDAPIPVGRQKFWMSSRKSTFPPHFL